MAHWNKFIRLDIRQKTIVMTASEADGGKPAIVENSTYSEDARQVSYNPDCEETTMSFCSENSPCEDEIYRPPTELENILQLGCRNRK